MWSKMFDSVVELCISKPNIYGLSPIRSQSKSRATEKLLAFNYHHSEIIEIIIWDFTITYNQVLFELYTYY